ncbi:MAG: cpaA [Devosia sp.]|uniref:A24 family peptidase n=1 Tax=Devosia sp. TaxID=1871048 RepID=UPI00260A0501|nr:prepilin peptidase [Devosia sp.]MDB5541891.1 cpaA [Devosia sp.]
MPTYLTIPLLFVFPLLMAYAASSDLLTMRISNRLILLLVAGFLAVALLAGLSLETIGMHLAAAAIVLVVSFTFFALRWIGGGDAKLIAATTLWFGFPSMLQYLLFASLLGGALTLSLLAVRRWPLPLQLKQVAWIDRLHDAQTGVPYGIALAAAGLLVYPTGIIFQRLIG